MIGAMPAVAVRHERRKGVEKRSKRPSQLYIGGHWLPPNSPSPTPSPNGPHSADSEDRLPEYYLCGKVSALQIIVGSILVGAIILIVGLVQLVPNAADADHRYIFLGSGTGLLILGFIMTGVRCFCIHCRSDQGGGGSRQHGGGGAEEEEGGGEGDNHHHGQGHHHGNGGGRTHLSAADAVVSSIDVIVQRRGDSQHQTTSPSELDSLIGNQANPDKENSDT